MIIPVKNVQTKLLLTARLKESHPGDDDPLALLRRLRVVQKRVQDLGPMIKQVDEARAQLVEAAVQLKGRGKETKAAIPQAARLTNDVERKLDDLVRISLKASTISKENTRFPSQQ